ncbi:MAG: nitroreductase family protein [Actinobacteria bacterium]|nr:nitroreductase family protein [Actinomycetota bacterium]
MTTASDPSYRARPLDFVRFDPTQMRDRARSWFVEMDRRRSVRQFSTEPVPHELIADAIRTASTAPSGAHMQPWTFVVVSDPDIRARIRAAAEAEEEKFYTRRAPDEWLEALAPLGTDAVKTHITDAPYVVVLFRHRHGINADGSIRKYYYTSESCGIAAGLFIAAVHHMGLATLPHTPSPMGFLAEILDRPGNEQAFLLLPVGYPAADAQVPDITRKPLDAVATWV